MCQPSCLASLKRRLFTADDDAEMRETPRRPSRLWNTAILTTTLAAVALAAGAYLYQHRATRPVGEGELFAAEAQAALEELERREATGEPLAEVVRHLRNRMTIEGVSVVDETGRYLVSTSPNLEGGTVDPFLLRGLEVDVLLAVALPIDQPILIDGVPEWTPGDVLYQVLQPSSDGGGLVLTYDISQLLQRRARSQGVHPQTLVLAGAAALFGLAAVLLTAGRQGARRRIEQSRQEARFLELRSQELEVHNRQLDEARQQAERALALAEETNRIRSEFVLMINHELRTPLTAVVTGAEILLENDDLSPAERRLLLEDVVRDGRRLKDLISQMLTVARIENRGLAYQLGEVRLSEVLRRIEAMSGRVRLPAPDGDAVLATDLDALGPLLTSLADNALTHGATLIELEVADRLPFEPMLTVGSVPDPALFLVVRDDGPGIDPEFLPRAFEKFEKQGATSGTGLGLYLARMMAEAIEGCIAVTTGPEGTSMAVGVPLVASPQPTEVAG